MKAKKHPNANLENYSKLFIQIGLVLSLVIVYTLLQKKTFEKQVAVLDSYTLATEDGPQLIDYKKEIPKIKEVFTPTIPTVIKKMDNDVNVEETIFKDIDVNTPVEPPVFIDIIDEGGTEEPIDYTINTIQLVPTFPGCKGNNEQMKACLSKKIRQFVGKKFNADLAETLGLNSGKQRIFTMFKIDENGNIVDVKAKAPHTRLEKEAIRVIKLLPQMQPGMQGGKKVRVKYAMPISFVVK